MKTRKRLREETNGGRKRGFKRTLEDMRGGMRKEETWGRRGEMEEEV